MLAVLLFGTLCLNRLAARGAGWGPGAEGWSGILSPCRYSVLGIVTNTHHPGPAPLGPSWVVCIVNWDWEGIYIGHRSSWLSLMVEPSHNPLLLSGSYFLSYRMSIGAFYLAHVIG